MRRSGVLAIFLIAAGALLALTVLVTRPFAGPWQVAIATGGEGGTYKTLGEHFADILQRRREVLLAKAIVTAGSRENIDLLVPDEGGIETADIALALRPSLAASPKLNQLRALAYLYSDAVQILVRNDADPPIESVRDLKGRRVYLGAGRSGTRVIAGMILDSFELGDDDYIDVVPGDGSFSAASELFQAEDEPGEPALDAAFVVAGMPTKAVKDALDSDNARLLDLALEDLKPDVAHYFKPGEITAGFYEKQARSVHTLRVETYLVCRRDLDDRLAYMIVQEIFDNLPELLEAHTKAHDINLLDAFVEWETPSADGSFMELHDGADQFREEEKCKLLIATGTLNGPYYELGQEFEAVLEQYGIPARAVQTPGSERNAELLENNDRPVVAIMQFDAALAALQGKTDFVYEFEMGFPLVEDLRRIAPAHDETLHIVARREAVDGGSIQAIEELDASRICVGPKGSGTQLVARAVLENAEIKVASPTYLPVPEMVARLNSRELDVGFFMSQAPSRLLETVLNNSEFRLLTIDPATRSKLDSFEMRTIEPGEYACLPVDSDPVQTIGAPAVVVTREVTPDVAKITRAIFANAAYLGYTGPDGMQRLARPVGTLRLHPDTKEVYRELGLLPTPPGITLQQLSAILAIGVFLIAGFKGAIKFKRDRIANEIGRRILAVPVEATAPDSVLYLLSLREESQECVRRRWWHPNEIDRRRWQYLDDLAVNRIAVAKENLVRSIVAQIRELVRSDGDKGEMHRQRWLLVERRVWRAFEKGELDGPQKAMLREIIAEGMSQMAESA